MDIVEDVTVKDVEVVLVDEVKEPSRLFDEDGKAIKRLIHMTEEEYNELSDKEYDLLADYEEKVEAESDGVELSEEEAKFNADIASKHFN